MAVDRLNYDRFKHMGDDAARIEGKDPDGDDVIRAVAECAIRATNDFVPEPGAPFMNDTFDERVDHLVDRIKNEAAAPTGGPIGFVS